MIFKFTLKNCPDYGVITVQIVDELEKTHSLKTPLRISPDLWDEQRERPRNIYLKKHKKLNVKLDRLRIVIADYLRDIKVRKTTLSLSALSRLIKGAIAAKDAGYKTGSLLDYVNKYIHSREHLISHATYKRYMVFFRLLERFDGYQGCNLLIEDVNAGFVKNFLVFGEAEAYRESTLHRTVHFVRTVLNFLEKRGVRTYVYELELPKEKGRKAGFVTLTEDELIAIERMAVPRELSPAKDWLIISCYSGQRISDFMNFSLDMLEIVHGKQCLSFVQQKTQKSILLPIHPAVLNIMTKNGGFPKKLPAQKYNKQIKEVARLAGINKLVKICKRRGFRSDFSLIPKWEGITSHAGRRSFASNFYGKIPTPLLMEATGHSSEQMFHRYISNVDIERTRSLGIYFDEAYKRKFLVA